VCPHKPKADGHRTRTSNESSETNRQIYLVKYTKSLWEKFQFMFKVCTHLAVVITMVKLLSYDHSRLNNLLT